MEITLVGLYLLVGYIIWCILDCKNHDNFGEPSDALLVIVFWIMLLLVLAIAVTVEKAKKFYQENKPETLNILKIILKDK